MMKKWKNKLTQEEVDLMTLELKQNLELVSKQKNQIETILQHMTDGIISFDMDGKITHINPAAAKNIW